MDLSHFLALSACFLHKFAIEGHPLAEPLALRRAQHVFPAQVQPLRPGHPPQHDASQTLTGSRVRLYHAARGAGPIAEPRGARPSRGLDGEGESSLKVHVRTGLLRTTSLGGEGTQRRLV